MAISWTDTPLIKKIQLPSGNEYFIADREAREEIQTLADAIAGGVSFIIAWDGKSTPVRADIPAGVVIQYEGSIYTGLLDADEAVPGAFYLIHSDTQLYKDVYDEYVPVGESGSKTWEKIGDTQVDLSNVVTDVTLNKSTANVIGSGATFTITQPTITLSTGSTGDVIIITGIAVAANKDDVVPAITGLGDPSTAKVIGSGATFTHTNPTVTLSTGATAGTGVVSVATGISSVTQPTVSLNGEDSSAAGRAQYIESLDTTKLSATASGGGVGWSNKDSKTVLTGVKVTTQPTVTLTANTATDTGRLQYMETPETATTTKLSATADITGKTTNVLTSVSSSSSKLATTTVKPAVSASGNFVTSVTSQTTADGTTTSHQGTAASPNATYNTYALGDVSVSNEVLSIKGLTLDTQTTNSGNIANVNYATVGSNVTVATGSLSTSGGGGSVVISATGGNTTAAVTSAPAVTISSGTTGDVTVVTGIVEGTKKYMSAAASGTVVGSNGTATVIGTNATLSHTNPTVKLVSGDTGDVTVVTGGTTKYMAATASGVAVTPTTTNLKATASGGSVAWNSKDEKTVVTGYANPTTDNVLGEGTTFTVTPTTTHLKATATNGNVAWNNKDQKTVLTSGTDITKTYGGSGDVDTYTTEVTTAGTSITFSGLKGQPKSFTLVKVE